MNVLKITTRSSTGAVEELHVEADRVLIGSGAHCDVRLPVGEARVEHVLVELGPAGLFARALAFDPAPTINSIPFTQAPLPTDALLGIGPCEIQVTAADANAVASAAPQKKGTSPITILAFMIMIPASIYIFFVDEPEGPSARTAPKEVPELWGTPTANCPHAGTQALAFAKERMAAADAKRERRPFHLKDGIQAVPVYEAAASCYRAGGDATTAALADEGAKFLRREMTDDFRSRRVRLEHALNTQDYLTAQKEVRVLLQFTEGKTGEYVTWLSSLERKLKLKVSEKKS